MRLLLAPVVLGSMAFAAIADAPVRPQICVLSDVIQAGSEDDPAEFDLADSWWYVNSDQTIWAGWDVVRMTAGPEGNKVLWLRPKGTQLVVSARRLDAEAAPAEIGIPCCYGGRLQASGFTFPSAGCWEVSAKAGPSELTFVTLVDPASIR